MKFEEGGKIEARGVYNLVNEILATALGNGMINKLKKVKSDGIITRLKNSHFIIIILLINQQKNIEQLKKYFKII